MNIRRGHALIVTVLVAVLFWQMGAADAVTRIGTGAAQNLFGTNAADVISGQGGADNLFGKKGSDRISESGVILPGAGKDLVVLGPPGGIAFDDDGTAGDKLNGNEGPDSFYAADGAKDFIHCGAGEDGVLADKIDVIAPDCELVVTETVIASATTTITYGTNAANTLTGTAIIDYMFGLAGNDFISGGGDADQIQGGRGKDVLNGEAGNDNLIDDDGTPGDTLKGGDDADTIFSADGAVDTIDCGQTDAATDTVYADPTDVLNADCLTDTVITS